ncbi:MAG: NapC/NirT family cytochrome c [Tannerellaceae bacterium]|jgi:hypothetical protein|nr:NapC/NirT family cytochrome c [Tannerellaceae bacterium]
MKKKKKTVLTIACMLSVALLLTASYTAWNLADPAFTCARCHEIKDSHTSWQSSAHAAIACTDCHGTALSEGFYSLSEKTRMLLTHLTTDKRNDDLRLNEQQVLALAGRCAECHRAEQAGWLAGGHGTTYQDIFLDETHNRSEKPYADCLRCHGMFYEASISELMSLEGEASAFALRDTKQASQPVIPCLSCHQMHSPQDDTLKTAFYVRAEKDYLPSGQLSKIEMYDKGRPVQTADDANTRLCLQCHSPNAWHQAGSSDDRTPTGVHEGLACTACHAPHSNDASASCSQCHPALSNCGLDVKTMDTSYRNPESPNNIHHISCTSCHEQKQARDRRLSRQPVSLN